MTTENAIKELRENISNYPVANVVVWRSYIRINLVNGKTKEFKKGIDMLEWMENEFRDNDGNLKKVWFNFSDF